LAENSTPLLSHHTILRSDETWLPEWSSNVPKWFAAVEVIRLATDKDWLHKATKEIGKHWRHKRGRRTNPRDAKAGFGPAPDSNPNPRGRHV
jgi:hypothetical protein